LIVFKWFLPKRVFALTPEILELARLASKFAGTTNESPKDVIFVNRNFMQGQIGGVNFLIALLAFGLKARGHKVTVLCESPKPWVISKEINGVSIVGIRPKLFFLNHSSPPFYAGWSRSVESYLDGLKGQPKSINVFATIAGLETLRSKKLPTNVNSFCYLVTDHIIHKFGTNMPPPRSGRISKFITSEREFLLSKDVHIIGDSRAIVEDISGVLKLPDLVDDTSIIHIGWPKNDRYEELMLPKGKLVTCIGAVSTRKGTRTLIDAWKLICDDPKLSDTFLANCGPTSDDPESEGIIADSPKSDRIIRIRSMNEGQKSFILNRSTLVVIPSNYESFGMVAVEAMQYNKRIFATNIGGLPEVLDGNAQLFPVGDFRRLANLLKSVNYSLEPEEIQKMQKRVNDFSVEQMVLSFEEICN
jgi:glycosyltransferase involved in cell wall biosynthesis